MINDILVDAESRMKSSIEHLEVELKKVRTGRASTGILEGILVEYYGAPTPLNQLATLTAEAQTLIIRPFDKTTINAIEKAIQESDIGLPPNNDGSVIRINIPALTQDRRKELVKGMGKQLEEAKVSIRNIRRSAIDDIRTLEKEKDITEDDSKDAQDRAQKLTDKYTTEVDDVGKRKEKEIMEF